MLRWGVVFVALDAVALLVLVLVLGRVPDWYRPVHVSPEQMERIQDELAEASNQFARDLFGHRMVTLRLTQAQLTEWLIASDHVERWLPAGLTDPLVVLREDHVILAATASRWGMEMVMALRWRPVIEDDEVRVELEALQIGALDVGPSTVKRLYGGDLAGASTGAGAEEGIRVIDLLDGRAWPNRFRWPNGGQHFRIDAVLLERGLVTLRVEPLGED